MKWVFLLGLLVFTPWLTAHLKANQKHLPFACFAIGILPFLMSGLNLTASPISWAHWAGAVKGFDISLLDGVALAVILATKPARTPSVLKISFAVYAIAVVVSTFAGSSGLRMASVFYAWQLFRAALVYAAVARVTVTHPKAAIAIAMGVGAGLSFQSLVAAQEYLAGNARAGGWFGHPNLLGMASHFAVYPALALLLAGHYSKQSFAIVAAGLLVAFTGGSRATIGLFAIGLVVTLCISLWRKSTGRKTAVAGVLFVSLLVALPVLFTAIERRSDEQRENSDLERSSMIRAAKMIIADHPLGVGANRYIVVANVGGYSDRAGMAWNQTSREAPVHNSFFLVTAELGWIGLIGVIGMFASVIGLAFRAVRRAPPGLPGELLVGVTGTLVVFVAHSYFEWITMYFHIHYLFAISVGLLVGLRQTATAQKRRARRGSMPSVELASSGA